MRISTKPFHLNFEVMGYQYRYDVNKHSSDNNWLETKLELIDPKKNSFVFTQIDFNLETYELKNIILKMKKFNAFVFYTYEQFFFIELRIEDDDKYKLIVKLNADTKEEIECSVILSKTELSLLILKLEKEYNNYPIR